MECYTWAVRRGEDDPADGDKPSEPLVETFQKAFFIVLLLLKIRAAVTSKLISALVKTNALTHKWSVNHFGAFMRV